MVSWLNEALTLAAGYVRLSENLFTAIADGQTMNLELLSLKPNKKAITVDRWMSLQLLQLWYKINGYGLQCSSNIFFSLW